uniref:LYR motif-containing protein 2 n=1 Tax=Sinocyclocheilus rhinocerous TaxID=307959 RepID=A0A673KI05_9TELE
MGKVDKWKPWLDGWIPPAALSLKQRQKVLGVYRDLLRTICKIPNEPDRRYLRDWAREEFKRNTSETDQPDLMKWILSSRGRLNK